MCEPEDGELTLPLGLVESLPCLSMIDKSIVHFPTIEFEVLEEFVDMEVDDIFTDDSPPPPAPTDLFLKNSKDVMIFMAKENILYGEGKSMLQICSC
mgnify:CR=1 FL=1